MTCEEILGIEPGPELDRPIAERVMGWKEGYEFVCDSWGLLYYANFGLERKRPWSPSTDIAAAWEVVNELVSKYSFELCSYIDILDNTRVQWLVDFVSTKTIYRVVAPTVPLAVCRAALLAVMGGE